LDRRFYELAVKLKAQKVMEVRRQMAWEQERCSIALRKLQEWYIHTGWRSSFDVLTLIH